MLILVFFVSLVVIGYNWGPQYALACFAIFVVWARTPVESKVHELTDLVMFLIYAAGVYTIWSTQTFSVALIYGAVVIPIVLVHLFRGVRAQNNV